MNIVLSTLLVIVLSSSFGEEIGLVGVIVATIITNLLICHIVEPYVLYKYAFKASPTKHILLNYICIAIFVVLLLLEEACLQSFSSQWTEFLVNAGISLLISGSISAVVVACDKNFRHYCRAFLFKK
jgi:Na+-driven multidrug efflux pump